MKLISKTISVPDRQIKANVTREMVDDIKSFHSFYDDRMMFEYKFNSEKEKQLIEKYFDILHIEKDAIYYSIDGKQLQRKIKLLVLKKDEISQLIEKILKNSKTISAESVMEMKLSAEIAKEIDKEILKGLISLSIHKT